MAHFRAADRCGTNLWREEPAGSPLALRVAASRSPQSRPVVYLAAGPARPLHGRPEIIENGPAYTSRSSCFTARPGDLLTMTGVFAERSCAHTRAGR